MKKFITITGVKHYYGHAAFKKGMKIQLIKEPDNLYDKEAIRAERKGLGQVGYVANSSYTVLGECMSAGRVYDKMGDTATAKVKYILPQGIVCKILKEKPDQSDLQMFDECEENKAGLRKENKNGCEQ